MFLTVSFFLCQVHADEPNIPVDYRWKTLLHYRDGKSEIDSPEFFIHADGAVSPQKELFAFEKLVKKEIESSSPNIICKFPLRFKYLVEKSDLKIPKSILNKCEHLNAFQTKMLPERVSVVFSSYFMGNPGSTFGHTLLKLTQKKFVEDLSKDPLLSYGVNYAASAGEERGFLYALKGLTGFYKGEFTLMPYYYKVREYNDYEARDLWIYNLNLTDEQRLKLIYHLWELKEASSDYYFFNKNCSYYVLKVLDVLLPEEKNLSNHHSWFAIPSETVKTINETEGLVENVNFRPSIKTRLDTKLQKLKNRKKVYPIVRDLNAKNKYKVEEDLSFETLDASLEMYDFLYSKEALKNETKHIQKKRPLLIQMSQKDKPESHDLDYRKNSSPPHLMHNASLLGLSVSNSETFKEYSIKFRPAFHSLLEPNEGVMKYGEIVLGKLSLGVLSNKSDGANRFNLNEADWIKISDYSPLQTYQWPMAWSVHLGSERPLYNQSYLENFWEMAFGVSVSVKNSSFISMQSFYKINFRDAGSSYRWSHEEGVRLFSKIRLYNQLNMIVSGDAFLRNDFKSEFKEALNYGLKSEIRWKAASNWSVGLSFEERFRNNRSELSIYYGY